MIKIHITNNKTHEENFLHMNGLYDDGEIIEIINDAILDNGWNISDCDYETWNDMDY